MNVVQREKQLKLYKTRQNKNDFVRRDSNIGIRGNSVLTAPKITFGNKNNRAFNVQTPRYQFNGDDTLSSKRSSMGPPLAPRSVKRKLIPTSSSRLETWSSKPKPRILANDSAAETTLQDFSTPNNKPTALRYISSSSKGGYSGNRSIRSTSTSALEASVILAISEGRGMARGEIGMAAIDLRHPNLVLCQFSDTLLYTHTLTKINYFNPVEIIVPHTFCEGVQPSQLYKLIRDQYPLVTLTTVQRRHFNDAAGRQQIQSLCAPPYNAVYLQILQKFYALTAAAAVLKYVEYIQCIVFARESLKIEYHSSENTMIIDVGTATQLELVQPLVPSAGPTCCLLGVLGPTYTIGGVRALRAAILQPSCKRDFIEARLDAIQDLIENETGLMGRIQEVIKKLSDIDKILLLCLDSSSQNMDKMGEAQLNQTLLLKTTMDIVPKLVETLQGAESGVLKKIKMELENPHYKEIAQRIRNVIQEDAHLEKGAMGSLQRCFAVKPDINGLLDVARRTYSELIEDIQKIVENLSETYDLPLRLNQNVMKGFHIILSVASKNRRNFNIEDLPPIFIQVQNNGASVSMSTEELVVIDQQAKVSLKEIQKMSNIVISGLLKELRPFMSSLYKLCENVAELDILLALAHASSVGSYIRPEFDNYMEIRNSVHPLLDYNSQVMPVPNDIFATPEHNFIILTGPNMGGKSIYIKQIALMQIMAQLGCFLPATNAILRLCDRVFSRIGFNDSVELNASTYVFEMKEMQHILQGLTSSSLVIIDELCRGTDIEEGTSIAWAICEELLMSDAFTFFTTHFMYLTKLQDLYYNVVNLQTLVAEEEIGENNEKKLVYQHKIVSGATEIENYGLALAANTNLPIDTVNLAKELAHLIVKNKKPQLYKSPEENIDKILYELNASIQRESRRNNSEDRTKEILSKFKENHPHIMKILVESNSNCDESDARHDSPTPSKQIELNSSFTKFVENSNDVVTLVEKNLEQVKNNTAYSISEGNNIETKDNCTTVKSSNELLNSVLNLSEDQSNDVIDVSADYNTDLNDKISNCFALMSGTNINVANSINIESKDQQLEHSKDNLFLSNGQISNENYNNSKSLKLTSQSISLLETSSGSSSDIADAMTQVLEECSLEEGTIELQINACQTSFDNELMRETIFEINKELSVNEIDNIILTPPFEFKD